MPVSRTPEIDIEQLDRARSAGAAVIDIREPSEYAAGHVPDAVLLPMGQLVPRLGELDTSRPIYLICATGNRSAAMADALVSAGYDAWSVAGGTAAWARSGRPLETS